MAQPEWRAEIENKKPKQPPSQKAQINKEIHRNFMYMYIYSLASEEYFPTLHP